MKRKVIFQYALIGVGFGSIFPFIATWIRIFTSGMPLNFESAIAVQSADPLLWIIDTAPIFLGLFAAIGGIRQARVLMLHQEQHKKIEELRTMTHQLRRLEARQELHVADRTRALQTSAEVSRKLSTILDPARLVREVVEQLQAAFGYYHAHIYLYDAQREYLVMVGGTGDAGRELLGRKHRIASGKGLVGRAAEEKIPVVVSDVSKNPDWLPNPLLPDTRSEIAVPILLGNQVLGVLDVQQNTDGAFSETDVSLLQSIATQVAIALQNAQSYERIERQVQRQERAAAITRKIQSATSIDDVLRIAVCELGQTVSARQVTAEVGLAGSRSSGIEPG